MKGRGEARQGRGQGTYGRNGRDEVVFLFAGDSALPLGRATAVKQELNRRRPTRSPQESRSARSLPTGRGHDPQRSHSMSLGPGSHRSLH